MKQLHNSKDTQKVAFITGAASGLGTAFAQALNKPDWILHLADINDAELESVSQKLSKAAKVYSYHLDVGSKIEFEAVSEQVFKNTSSVDLLINNAGIGDGELFESYAIDHWERMIRINLMGVFYGCHYFVPRMIQQESGTIINIGSAAGFMNAPGMSAYNTSKAAVYSLSETLYHELKTKNIHVSVATPTFFKTNIMSEAAGSERFVDFAEKQMRYSKTNADEMAKIILSGALKKQFQIIYPQEAKRNHFLKKWFPGLVAQKFQQLLRKFHT